MYRYARILVSVSLLATAMFLSACSTFGSGLGGIFQLPCNTGTQQQLASPFSGQTGVSPSIGQVTIVANGNSNQLYSNYNQWTVTLVDNLGAVYNGGHLALVPDPSGPHPYPSDFYYASSLPQLTVGRTYTASLGIPGGSCQSISMGSFST